MSVYVYGPQEVAAIIGGTQQNQNAYIPSGGFVLGGTGNASRGNQFVPAGGLLFAGTAIVSYFSFTNQLVVTGAGGLIFGGSAKLPREWVIEEMPADPGWTTDPDFGRGF